MFTGRLVGNRHNGKEKASGAPGGGDERGEPEESEHSAPRRHKANYRGSDKGRQH